MKVLGISPLDKDSTVSIVEDGQILFAAAEERYTRVKQQNGFPANAIQRALEYTSSKASDIDQVVYPFMGTHKEKELIQGNLSEERVFLDRFRTPPLRKLIDQAMKKVPERKESIHGLKRPNEVMDKGLIYGEFYKYLGTSPTLSKIMAQKGSKKWSEGAGQWFSQFHGDLDAGLNGLGLENKLNRLDHHLSHAANAYFSSGFENALCVTLDGYGTGLTGSVSEAKNGKIKRLHGVSYPNSLGTLYEHVTSSLGYKPTRHEGKIVGLASYGDPDILSDILLSRIEQSTGDFKIYQSNNIYFSRFLASRFPKIDVAAAYQKVLEVVATNYVKHWVEKTGIDTIVLSGGVTANVKLNQRLFEIENVKNVFVYPNMGDGGCGTGAALYRSIEEGVKPTITSVYFGPEFSDEEIKNELNKARTCV